MRYREISDVKDFSRDVEVVIDFIGEQEYRRSLKAIEHSLNLKGFVTAYDDALFALELDLLNLERLRAHSSGKFQFLPAKCHAGVDFLIGLGQTIPILSPEAKARLLGRLKSGLREGLWPLQHELNVAADLSKHGWDIYLHDFEEGGGYDFLVSQKGMKFEVEAKAISAFAGWPIKPENLNKLLVEIKQHFHCDSNAGIPLIGLKLPGNLLAERTHLQELVSALTKVARTKQGLSVLGTQIRFMGTIPDMTPQQLRAAASAHTVMAREIVLATPKVVLELHSDRPRQLARKIIRTINDAAREQFTGLNPAVIWTRVNFITKETFTQLSSPQEGRASFLDRVASTALLSEKRNHLSQLVFSAGSSLEATGAIARSSSRAVVYNSPICRFGNNVIFPGGRTRPAPEGSHAEKVAPVRGFPTTTEEEQLRKNSRCDLLMKEGIDGREDADAVIRTMSLTDLAVELGRQDGLTRAIEWCEALERRGVCNEDAVFLDFSRANAIGGKRYGTKWQWDQPILARELYYLRRAVSNPGFPRVPDTMKCMCFNNLGNRFEVTGRIIEALDCWRRALEVLPNFGISLCNRARALAAYAQALEDTSEQALFLWVAHGEASTALAPTPMYTAVRDKRTMEATKALKEWIESVIDVKGIASENPLAWQDAPATDQERDYCHWCLVNCLFLNPSNDLGPHSIAACDSIGLPVHAVQGDATHKFESLFDQVEQEYVSARWLLYEGSVLRELQFSRGDGSLQATEPPPSLSPATEKVITAYRASYSLFDKMGLFINAYMELGIPDRKVTFRTIWKPGQQEPVRNEFDLTSNWGFCALYWLAEELFENEIGEAADQRGRGQSEAGTPTDHECSRAIAVGSPTVRPDHSALTGPDKEFEAEAMHLLKLARSAIIYLTIGVRFEEQRREPARARAPIQELPPISKLTESEKI